MVQTFCQVTVVYEVGIVVAYLVVPTETDVVVYGLLVTSFVVVSLLVFETIAGK